MKQYFIFTITLLFSSTAFAQYNSHDPNGEIDAILKPLIKARFDERYSYVYQVIDSMIGGFGDFEEEEIQDPYGTLKGCTVFAVDKGSYRTEIADSSYFGILKNGNIVWLSPPIFKGSMSSVFAARDINNDGKVEILTTWCNIIHITIDYMWIISWDGTSGSIINALNDGSADETEMGNSVLISSASYELFDAKNDNIYEIRGYWTSDENDRESWYFPETPIPTRPWVTYKWNGSVYDIAPNSEQIPVSAFLPANQLTVDVGCKVSKTADSLEYVYTWKNSPSSKQRMNLFVLSEISPFLSSRVRANWRYNGMRRGLSAHGWSAEGVIKPKYTIGAGQKVKGLTLISTGLPGIVQFYIQGYRPQPEYNLSAPNIVEQTMNDLLNNSYKGFTVGPIPIPGTFNPTVFVDSLISYTKQSVTLGWLAQKRDLDTSDGESNKDSIATNLIKRLQTIKSTIQQGNLVAARTLLQKFIDKVEAEHARGANRMSDECYALLKYNSEYLRDKLPSQ